MTDLWSTPLRQFQDLGWYMIAGVARPCPVCGVLAGGGEVPWHVYRDGTDDEAVAAAAHGWEGPTDAEGEAGPEAEE